MKVTFLAVEVYGKIAQKRVSLGKELPMKSLLPLSLIVLLAISCKSDKKETPVSDLPEPTILEKIANAHGFQNWKNVNEIAFTFNVDRDSTHFERSWIWLPKTNQITRISGTDTLTYFRKSMDSVAFKTNAGFINDRYWLLAPFNLIWDGNNFSHEHFLEQLAPISQKSMQKLTIVYKSEGGYTPGDAYDFYFEEDHLIKEWVFRKANQADPSMITTWENYQSIEGLQLAIDHKKKDVVFNIYFDGIEVDADKE